MPTIFQISCNYYAWNIVDVDVMITVCMNLTRTKYKSTVLLYFVLVKFMQTAIHVYACAVYYWWVGPLIFIQLVVAYHLAESQSLACYTTR